MVETESINLVSKEGDVFPVPLSVAKLSGLVTESLSEDDDDDNDKMPDIPLPNVSSVALQKALDYCTHYQTEKMTPIQTPLKSNKIEEMVQKWYSDFVKVDRDMLFDLVAAANYMDIKPMLDLTCLAVSVMIKGKSAPELREMFNIPEELTPEERAQAQRDNTRVQNAGANNKDDVDD